MKLYIDVRLATDADAMARRVSLKVELEPDGFDPLVVLIEGLVRENARDVVTQDHGEGTLGLAARKG